MINKNEGPGWHDHDTPYGSIHSYDGNDTASNYGEHNGDHGHDGITDKTKINIASTNSYDGSYMTMCINNLKRHEGFKNTMYKDSLGNITIGIGHLLATADMAAMLPFTRTDHISHGHGDTDTEEQSLTADQIKTAFNRYKDDSNYSIGQFHISNDSVIGQSIKDVQTTETGLRGLYSDYDDFSESRKMALIDMGFNLGVSKLATDFPKFNDAVNRGDWSTAAAESHRAGLDDSKNSRNKDTREQLLSDEW